MATLTRSTSHVLADLEKLGYDDLAKAVATFRAEMANVGFGCDVTAQLKEEGVTLRLAIRQASPEADVSGGMQLTLDEQKTAGWMAGGIDEEEEQAVYDELAAARAQNKGEKSDGTS